MSSHFDIDAVAILVYTNSSNSPCFVSIICPPRESDFYIEKDLWDWSPDEDDNDPETEKFLWREIITDALHMLAHRVA